MANRYDYEAKFDRAQQRAQRRNDEIVRKFRHKKQDVFKAGQMFRVDLNGFVQRRRNGALTRFWAPTGMQTIVATKDSSHYVTIADPSNVWARNMGFTTPLRLWPFLWGADIVWYALPNCEDPLADLRASFLRIFKIVK